MKKFKPGDTEIYQQISEGLSYHQTTGEVYHTNRSKAKFYKLYQSATAGISRPRVLDIGCGIGTELFMLPKVQGGKYIGVDVSKPAIDSAKKLALKRGESQIDFHLIDANVPLPFPNSSFDVIYALELIEHLKDPGNFLKDIIRLLKPSGHLILSTPNGSSLPNLLPKILPTSLTQPIANERKSDFTRHGQAFDIDSTVWDTDAHISLLGYAAWQKIFSQNGLAITKVEGSSFFGGSRFISNRPFLLGLTILLDSIVDLLPFKPHLQMCLLVSLQKTHV